MKRAFLSNLGLDKDVIDRIMQEHGVAIEAIKEKNKLLQEQLNNYSNDVDWKAKYETELNAHIATREKIAAEADSAETERLIHDALLADGVIPGAAKLLISAVDSSAIVKDNGAISNWHDISSTVKSKFPDLFASVVTVGADVGSPANFSFRADDPFVSGFDA